MTNLNTAILDALGIDHRIKNIVEATLQLTPGKPPLITLMCLLTAKLPKHEYTFKHLEIVCSKPSEYRRNNDAIPSECYRDLDAQCKAAMRRVQASIDAAAERASWAIKADFIQGRIKFGLPILAEHLDFVEDADLDNWLAVRTVGDRQREFVRIDRAKSSYAGGH